VGKPLNQIQNIKQLITMKKLILALLALVTSGFCLSAHTLSNYQATVNGQNPNYYYTFDNGSVTSIGASNAITLTFNPTSGSQVGFGYDAYHNPGNCVYFSASADALDYPYPKPADLIIYGGGTANTNSTKEGSITFLFKSLDPGSNTHQCYIFSAGYANANHNALSLYIENTNAANGDPNCLKLRFGDHSTTILQQANIVPDTWHYFAFTYTEATNNFFWDSTGTNLVTIKGKWYLGRAGGTLASDVTTNAVDVVAGEANVFAIGDRSDLNSSAGFDRPGTGMVDEFATWSRRLTDTEITNQFSKLPNNLTPPPRSTYQGVITAQSPSYYFKFDGDYVDSVGGTLTLRTNGPTIALTYDYFGGPTNAVIFTSGGDALTNNGNLLNGGGSTYTGNPGTGQGALSFIFRSIATNNQGTRTLYDAGGDTNNNNQFSLFFNTYSSTSSPLALKLRFGDSSTAILQPTNMVPFDWYYFAMTYDETKTNKQVKWWLGLIGGTLNSGTLSATNGALAGQGNVFVIGSSSASLVNNSFRNSTPSGQGRIDEFAIWHRLLLTNEVVAQFSALTFPPPTLSIAVSGTNAIISWPSSTDSGYSLQSTTNLASPNWLSAGASFVVGTNNVVTNSISGSAQFYRLTK
jgi:hypothetical protein